MKIKDLISQVNIESRVVVTNSENVPIDLEEFNSKDYPPEISELEINKFYITGTMLVIKTK